MSNAKRLLLSGYRGCIGRAFLIYMKREHPEVEIVTLKPFPFSIQKIHDQLVAEPGFDWFINCAAVGKNSESKEIPLEYYQTNAWGVMNQLEMIRLYSPRTRYLNLGSIYQDTEFTPYASSKRIAAELVKSYRENFGLYAVTARLGFTEYYGRDESYLSRKITKGVARIARAIKDGKDFEPLSLWNVDDMFTWAWGEDVADGMWKMLNWHDARDGRLIPSMKHSVREFVEYAFTEVRIRGIWRLNGATDEYLLSRDGILATKKYIPLVRGSFEIKDSSGAWKGESEDSFCNFGWFPRFSFGELVREMVQHDLREVGL